MEIKEENPDLEIETTLQPRDPNNGSSFCCFLCLASENFPHFFGPSASGRRTCGDKIITDAFTIRAPPNYRCKKGGKKASKRWLNTNNFPSVWRVYDVKWISTRREQNGKKSLASFQSFFFHFPLPLSRSASRIFLANVNDACLITLRCIIDSFKIDKSSFFSAQILFNFSPIWSTRDISTCLFEFDKILYVRSSST